MRVDPSKSKYHESPAAETEFDLQEIKHLRFLLRRLRFLEKKVRENGGLVGAGPSDPFAELEVDALAYALLELGYLAEPVKS